MRLKYIIPILFITLILDSIQSKCISYVTPTNSLLLTSTNPSTQVQTSEIKTSFAYTSVRPTKSKTNAPISCPDFQNLPYTYLNLQAFQDFQTGLITSINLNPAGQSVACSCASRCQQTTNCVYFESYYIVLEFKDNCYLYQFKSPTNETLKNNLQRGIYYSQDSNITSGLSKFLFS
jgi:hypothetical protein